MSGVYLTARRARELADQLSPPDWQVIEYVSARRFLTGGQLTRLCFADSDDPTANARAARRALLRLTRLGVLERLPRRIGGRRAGSVGFVYRLGLGGHRLAALRGLLPTRQRRRSLVPGTLFLRHSLMVNELHVQLIECERATDIELLALEGEPSCWRSLDGLADQRLKPDSYVRLGIGDYEDSYFIEVDRATEGSQTIVRQLERYIAYYQSGREQATHGVFPKVLWLTPDKARAQAIRGCIEQLPSDAQALFAVAPFAQALAVMTTTGNTYALRLAD